jgi:predicted lipoprotein with Yx(FWY)xxD motif
MDQDIVLKIVRNFVLLAIAANLLAACSGGSSVAPGMKPTQAPGGSGVLSTRTLKGAPGFVNAAKFTVYVFDLDLTDPGHSTCNAGNGCSQNWPPVRPPAGMSVSAQFSTIRRNDGTPQLAYAGRPLYTFVVDAAPGQTNGDGVDAFGGLWHIARPQGASPQPSASPLPTSTPYP